MRNSSKALSSKFTAQDYPMQLFDTHCHIHEAIRGVSLSTEGRKRYEKAGSPSPDSIIRQAVNDGVTCMLCVGTTLQDSELAVAFVQGRSEVWATIGIHPHEAKEYIGNQSLLDRFASLATKPKVVGVGECGLDYYYTHSQPHDQAAMLRFQIELALKHDLPMVFHVRDAFDDFWPIFDSYKGIRGVIHSFSATEKELAQILERGLYVGLNGIMTFTKNEEQLAAAKAVPRDGLVLETDAPFLTPTPYRGTMCQPKHVRVTAEFLANLRQESTEELARYTTANARKLFGIK